MGGDATKVGRAEMSGEYVNVGRVSDFPKSSLRQVTVAGEEVVVGNIEGKLYAIADKCTHRGGPLNEGELEGTKITCPWHGGQFDMVTGKVLEPPPMKDNACFEVQLDGDNVLVRKK
jgi:nitrite reductase/ring-hydroxylating ferredoxin subunit